MIEISSAEAFWILEAYRKMASQLQVSGIIGNESISLPGMIWWTMPANSKASIALLEDPKGQKRECRLDLSKAKFSFDPMEHRSSSSDPVTEVWLSYLRIEVSDSLDLLIGERFVGDK